MIDEIMLILGIVFSFGLIFSAYRIRNISKKVQIANGVHFNSQNDITSVETDSLKNTIPDFFLGSLLINGFKPKPFEIGMVSPQIKEIEYFCKQSNTLWEKELPNITFFICEQNQMLEKFSKESDKFLHHKDFKVTFKDELLEKLRQQDTKFKVHELTRIYFTLIFATKYFSEIHEKEKILNFHFFERTLHCDEYMFRFEENIIGENLILIE